MCPFQQLQFLGFIINSNTMTVTLTTEKKDLFKKLINEVLSSKTIRIRKLACVIGKIVSSFPASTYGPLYYRKLEKEKIAALKLNKGNYDKQMSLGPGARMDLQWWIDNLDNMHALIQLPPITQEIYADASKTNGWGGVMGCVKTGGAWKENEFDIHINVKEMMAIYYSIRSFKDSLCNKHIKVLSDSTTAVAVINKMGTTHSDQCNEVAQLIWQYCAAHTIWITCAQSQVKITLFLILNLIKSSVNRLNGC